MFCDLESQYNAGGEGMPTFNIFFGGCLQYTGERFQTFCLSSFIIDIKHKCFNILMG